MLYYSYSTLEIIKVLIEIYHYEKDNSITSNFAAFDSCSCDKESDCEGQQILPITSLKEKYGCSDTKFGVDIALVDNYTIIRSQPEYDSLVTSTTCNPQIDSSTYDLLIGKQWLARRDYTFFDYILRRDCESNKLLLTVIIDYKGFTNDTTLITNITYHALIPKLRDNDKVDINFSMRYSH